MEINKATDFDRCYSETKIAEKHQVGAYTISRDSKQLRCVMCNVLTFWRDNESMKPVCSAGCLHYHRKKLMPITVNQLIAKLQELVKIDPPYGQRLSYLSPEGEKGESPQNYIEKWPPDY